jgi:small neutral amino acid transporter SnatA (MarC family)
MVMAGLQSTLLMLTLINPFLVIIYLVDVVENLEKATFRKVLIRAGIIASAVFCVFALLGDAVFSRFMQVEFASFQIFGGIIFLLIGVQFVFNGPRAIEVLRGKSAHVAGAIAMPVLIGPGSISASVVIGKRHDPLLACGIILIAVFISLTTIILLKTTHDRVRPQREALIERYIEVAGRVLALFAGTVAIDMIMQGIKSWAGEF